MPAVAVLHVPVAGARRRVLEEVAWVPDARRPLSFSSPVVVLTPCPPLPSGEGGLRNDPRESSLIDALSPSPRMRRGGQGVRIKDPESRSGGVDGIPQPVAEEHACAWLDSVALLCRRMRQPHADVIRADADGENDEGVEEVVERPL